MIDDYCHKYCLAKDHFINRNLVCQNCNSYLQISLKRAPLMDRPWVLLKLFLTVILTILACGAEIGLAVYMVLIFVWARKEGYHYWGEIFFSFGFVLLFSMTLYTGYIWVWYYFDSGKISLLVIHQNSEKDSKFVRCKKNVDEAM